MKISACLIVKDEETNITYCLNSMQNIPSEFIVVDTGSTDKTKELAREFGAVVYDYEWDDNFSNAKNFALSKATGDWIIFLDADEFFDNKLVANLSKILTKIDGKKEIDCVACKMIHIEKGTGDIRHINITVRIFRRDNIRFVNAIHETIYNTTKPLNAVRVEETELVIYHTGYSEGLSKHKAARNLKLLLNQLGTENENPATYFYLSDCYIVLGQYDLAIKYSKMYLNTGHQIIGFNSSPYQNIIKSMIELSFNLDIILDEVFRAIKKFPKHPAFQYLLGKCFFAQGKYQAAYEAFLNALKLQSKFDGVEINFVPVVYHEIYYFLGIISEYKNEAVQAIDYYIEAIKSKKYYEEAFKQLALIVRTQMPEDIIQLINSLYDKNNEGDMKFLINQLSKLKYGKVLMYYSKIWYKQFGKEDSTLMFTFLANGYYEDAYKYFYRTYKENYDNTLAILCILAAILSGQEDKLNEVINYVKPAHKRIISLYQKREEAGQFPILEDSNDYLAILREFVNLGDSVALHRYCYLIEYLKGPVILTAGRILEEAKLYVLAIDCYSRGILQAEIDQANLNCRIGFCYYKLFDYSKAVDAFSIALAKGYTKPDIDEFVCVIKG